MITFFSALEYCEAQLVHTVPCMSRQEVSMYHAPWKKLPIIDFAELQCADELDGGQRLYETRVTAMTANRVNLPSKPLVFRLTDVYGDEYLLGVPEFGPPLPLLTQADKAAAKPAESSLCKLYIRLRSVYPLLKII